MIEFFTFLWGVVTGLIEMMGTLISSIGMLSGFVMGFGALGAFLAVLLTVRIVKWVMNR